MASESSLPEIRNLSIAIRWSDLDYNVYIVEKGCYTRRQTCVYGAGRVVMRAEIEFQSESGPASGAWTLQPGV